MKNPIQLPLDQLTEPGLYLLFDDGLCLTGTRKYIGEMKQRYLHDPLLMPQSVRAAPAYAPCSVCPKKDTALICHAIPTVFPFIEDMDRFLSHETVLAVFRSEPSKVANDGGVLYVARTSVQRALQHISILSMLQYCEVGQIYFKYFAGVIPLMDPLAIVERVYLNIYWDLQGDLPAVHALMTKMRTELDVTLRCQMDRLQLFCQSDAFLNAFVITHIMTQLLDTNMEAVMRETFNSRNAPVAE